ncbi:MAG TPA: hypothetical protein VEF76_11310 [Patescibacteria group bacterium]|nr:hypothetical protein [Patescibacteria group bacterium]
MRKPVILWLTMAALCSGLLFQTSQRVNDGRAQLAAIEADTKKEEEHIRVLEAEWSYLNQPDRLEKLSRQYLQLAPLKGKQFAKLEDIPARPAPEVPAEPATAAPQNDIEPAPALVTDEVEGPAAVVDAEAGPALEAANGAAQLAKPVPTKPATAASATAQKWQPVVKAKPQTGLIWRAPPPPAARRKDFVWSAPPPRAAQRMPAPAYTPPKPQAQPQPPQQRRSFGELMKSLGVQ